MEGDAVGNPFKDVDVGSWAYPTCRDFDNDRGNYLMVFKCLLFSVPANVVVPVIIDFDCLVGNGLGTLDYFEKCAASRRSHNLYMTLPYAWSDLSPVYICCSTGSVSSPTFVRRTGNANPMNGVDVGYMASPTCADFNKDDKIDCIIGQQEGSTELDPNWTEPPPSTLYKSKFYLNTGSKINPVFTLQTAIRRAALFDVVLHHPFCIDFDNDGDTGNA